MEHIKSPQKYDFCNGYDRTLFIGGGITGCPNWQKEMVERFKDVEHIVLFNPRRDNFDVRDPSINDDQLEWEHRYLIGADAVLFWFPFHGPCIITMYELGMIAALGKKMFVGAHPAYERVYDVKKQLEMIRPDVVVRDNFGTLVEDVMRWYNER